MSNVEGSDDEDVFEDAVDEQKEEEAPVQMAPEDEADDEEAHFATALPCSLFFLT